MTKHLQNLFTVGATAVLSLSASALAQFEGQVSAVPEPEAALVLLPAAAYLALKEHKRRAKAKKRDD